MLLILNNLEWDKSFLLVSHTSFRMRTDYRITPKGVPSFSLSRSPKSSALFSSQSSSQLDRIFILGFRLDDAYNADVLPDIVTVGAVEVCLKVTPANEITSSFLGSSNSMFLISSERFTMSVRPL